MNVDESLSLLSSFRAGIVALRQDGAVAYVNPIGVKILEGAPLKPGESIHKRAAENHFFRGLSEALSMSYLPTRVDAEVPGRDGEKKFIGFTLSEWKRGSRKIGICAFFKDLTHVEMAEENENLKQRLLMLGQMAAGLAHEIRNPISSIGIHCSLLRSRLSGDDKLLSSVNMMVRELEKVEYIIRQCLNFVRPTQLKLQPVRIDALIEEVIGGLKLQPGMGIVMRRPKDGEITADVDKGLMEQALTNLLINAVDACEGRGKVEVSLGISRHYMEPVRLSWQIRPDLDIQFGEKDYVRIHIRDNGRGIPEEIRDKIFVPFFTTKKSGTGIGLPLAQKIIHAHGGVLDLTSTVGEGTEFVIKIPLGQRSPKEGAPSGRPATPKARASSRPATP